MQLSKNWRKKKQKNRKETEAKPGTVVICTLSISLYQIYNAYVYIKYTINIWNKSNYLDILDILDTLDILDILFSQNFK